VFRVDAAAPDWREVGRRLRTTITDDDYGRRLRTTITDDDYGRRLRTTITDDDPCLPLRLTQASLLALRRATLAQDPFDSPLACSRPAASAPGEPCASGSSLPASRFFFGSRPASAKARRSRNSNWPLTLRRSSSAQRRSASKVLWSIRSKNDLRAAKDHPSLKTVWSALFTTETLRRASVANPFPSGRCSRCLPRVVCVGRCRARPGDSKPSRLCVLRPCVFSFVVCDAHTAQSGTA